MSPAAENNYEEEAGLLLRLLETKAFRFVLVRFNQYALRDRLIADILARFPGRDHLILDATDISYRQFMNAYEELGEGLIFVDNFEKLLDNPEIYTGLNLRRDKLAQYPIAMICLLPPGSRAGWARDAMTKMPDLWSFKNLILNLQDNSIKINAQPKGIGAIEHIPSSLGGSTQAGKAEELNRLLALRSLIEHGDAGLRLSLNKQIQTLQIDLGQYEAALVTTDEILSLVDKSGADDVIVVLLEKGGIYSRIDRLKEAVEIYEDALQRQQAEAPDHPMIAYLHTRRGTALATMNRLDEAKSAFQEAVDRYTGVLEVIGDDLFLKEQYAETLILKASSHFLLSEYPEALNDISIAISLLSELITKNEDSEKLLLELSKAYITQGGAHLAGGNIEDALASYQNFITVSRTLFDLSPTRVYRRRVGFSLERLGKLYMVVGGAAEAMRAYQEAYDIYKLLLSEDPADQKDLISLIECCSALVDLFLKRGEYPKAQACFSEVTDIAAHHSSGTNTDTVSNGLETIRQKLVDNLNAPSNDQPV